MYTDPWGKEHRYGPPQGWTQPTGQVSLGPAEWDARVERGLHFEPYGGNDAHVSTVRGTCLNPLIWAGDRLHVRPVGPDESLIDGGLYCIAWDDEEEVQQYREKINAPGTGLVIAKFLHYVGNEWWCQCADNLSTLKGLVVGEVVGVDSLTPVYASGIGLNAATDVLVATNAGPVNVYTASSSYPATLLASLTTASYPWPSSVVITVTGSVDHYFPSAQCSTCALISASPLTTFSATPVNWIARNAGTAIPGAGGSWAREMTFAQAAGAPATYYLYGLAGVGSAVSGAYSNIYGVTMKCEVLKR